MSSLELPLDSSIDCPQRAWTFPCLDIDTSLIDISSGEGAGAEIVGDLLDGWIFSVEQEGLDLPELLQLVPG